jgi:sugar phosphate isomerase/epimerase
MDVNLNPSLGIAHFTCIDAGPSEFARLAARIGYANVGIRLHPAFPGAPSYELRAGSYVAREFARILDGEGISVYDIEFVAINAEFDASALTQMVEDAGSLGARRLSVCGDDPDRSRLVANFVELCDLVAKVGMSVDLEVMPWRSIGTLKDAVAVTTEAGRANAGVLIDALHLDRSGGEPEEVSALPPGIVRSAQLCDAIAQRPADIQSLIAEARGGRLLPGDGALPLTRLVAALPDSVTLSVEVPNAGLTAEEHARRVYAHTRQVLSAMAVERSN